MVVAVGRAGAWTTGGLGTRTGSPAALWSPLARSAYETAGPSPAQATAGVRAGRRGQQAARLAAAEPARRHPGARRPVPAAVAVGGVAVRGTAVGGAAVAAGAVGAAVGGAGRAVSWRAAARVGGYLRGGRSRADLLRDQPLAAEQLGGPLDEAIGQPDQGRQSLRQGGPQPDPDPVPLGQPRDGEQAHVPGDGDVDRRRVVQPPVHLLEPGLGHADALVADLDEHAATGQVLHGDLHLGVLGREDRGVLDQLGEQVHHVGDRLADQRDVRRHVQRDPVVLLDLRGRGAGHVGERYGLRPLARVVVPGEQQQVLRVTAHAGDQVVHGEEAAEAVGIVLVLLQVCRSCAPGAR